MQCVMQVDQINWPTTIGNLGLWTCLGIPTKATRLKTHQAVRFFCLDFPALLIFVSVTSHMRGGPFLLLLGRAIPTQIRPTQP